MAIVIPILTTYSDKGVKAATADIKQAQGAFGKTQAVAKTALVPALAVLGGLGAVAGKLAKGASEDAAAAAKLGKALQNTTGASEAQIAANEEWIASQGRLLGVTDDELRPAIQTLAAASGDLTQAQKDAAVAMDIAASAGVDTETASKAIAKAYDGSFGALKKLVPGIDDAALASKDFGAVMDSTNKIVGGQAATAAATSEGKMKIFSTTIAELGESFGAALLPAIEAVMPLIQSFGDFLSNHTTLLLVIVGAVAGLAAAIVVLNVALSVYNTITALIEINTKRAAAGQSALNAAMLLNPVFLVVVAVIALVAAIVILWRKNEGFRRVVTNVWNGILAVIKTVASGIWNGLKALFGFLATLFKFTPLGLLITHFRELKRVVGVVADAIQTAWQHVWDFVSGIFDKIAAGIDRIKGLFGGVGDIIGKLNPFSASAGAPVGASSRSSTSGTVYNLSVSGAVDPEGTARSIQRTLSRHDARQGSVRGSTRALAW